MTYARKTSPKLTRRGLLATLPCAALVPTPVAAFPLDAEALGVVANSGVDVTNAMRSAIEQAAGQGRALSLSAGEYLISGLELPSGTRIEGSGAKFVMRTGNVMLGAQHQSDIHLHDISFSGSGLGVRSDNPSMVQFRNCDHINLSNCSFENFEGNGLFLEYSSATVVDCSFENFGQSAIHCQDGRKVQLRNNRIANMGNGGIRIWRYEKGFDGTIATGNQIENIKSDWGDGQNGNGINIFYADGCVVSNNVIRNCDLSAIRANSTKDTIISSNQCHNSLEVGIFSEFEFSGSIIANNLVDGAATGMSITNLDDDGHLAVCSGNIVRNITPFSPTNPDTVPIGIYAEAEVAVSGNVIEDVPGAAIAAGFGGYLRNVSITNNIMRRAVYGVAISVAEGAGTVHIADNLLAEIERAPFAGFEWTDFVTDDLSEYDHVKLSDNYVA